MANALHGRNRHGPGLFDPRLREPRGAPPAWRVLTHAPARPHSSRYGVLFPMEGGRWSVSLAENHGNAPPGDVDGFMEFLASLLMPTIHRALRGAKRIGDIARLRMPCSVRCGYDRLDRFPRGLVPLGAPASRF